uniref:Putative coactivator CBP, KIX domain-containing protein n=1 Tax=Helianthus annuus TaxID=4232 RepID=A0A251V869_HELAN
MVNVYAFLSYGLTEVFKYILLYSRSFVYFKILLLLGFLRDGDYYNVQLAPTIGLLISSHLLGLKIDHQREDMDTSNGSPTQVAGGAVGDPTTESGDWRAQLAADSRERITYKILDTLKRHLPYSGDEGLEELKKIAVRFEEKIYTAATSQSDYLQKIPLKMLTMETRSQNPISDPMQSNSAATSE